MLQAQGLKLVDAFTLWRLQFPVCCHLSLFPLTLMPQQSATLVPAYCFPFPCNFSFPRLPWLLVVRPCASSPRNVCLHLNPPLSPRKHLVSLCSQGSRLQPRPLLPRHQLGLLFRIISCRGQPGHHTLRHTTPRLLMAGRRGKVYCSVALSVLL